MQTNFSLAQLADPALEEANTILRSCVHCGFCNATCPTFGILGDERDGPRGRIYLIKDMLESGRPASSDLVTHVDRCLSCLACMTTCPSSVNYMHLVDEARHRIETTYERPFVDRWLRWLLATTMPHPVRFRLLMIVSSLLRPFLRVLPGRLGAMAALVPARVPAPGLAEGARIFPAEGPCRKRVVLLTSCVQTVLAPGIDEATIRLLQRHGCDVVIAPGAGCCGAVTHHMGRDAGDLARANIDAWTNVADDGGLDAIVINSSGCGVMVKDYGHMLRTDRRYADAAYRISALAKDVSEVLTELGLNAPTQATGQRVAYHSACALQHGQRIHDGPKRLLAAAGFTVLDVPDGHLCCGSAGTYNMLQPELSGALRAKKLAAIDRTGAELVAAGNLGCMVQLAGDLPVAHTVELLNWATGGRKPASLG